MSELTPNVTEIRRAIDLLFDPVHTVELRAFGTKKGTCVGFYRDRAALAAHAAKISANSSTPAVFWTLQEIDPKLFVRAPDQFQTHVGSGVATADANVLRYRWLLIDCDPRRNPTKISSTDVEKAEALDVATTIRDYFSTINGWDGYASVLADSGNGYHVLLRIDLDNSEKSKLLYSRVLQSLNQQFSTGDETGGTKIDVSVFNPSRICKIYGTVVRKGSDTPERPHRIAHLLDIPKCLPVVPREVLEIIAAKSQASSSTQTSAAPSTIATAPKKVEERAVKMEKFLAESKLSHRKRMEYDTGGCKWQLENCPFNPEHKAPDSYVFIKANGAMGFHCSHNTCVENKWDQFREHAEHIVGHRFKFAVESSASNNQNAFAESGGSPPPNRSAEIPRIEIDDEKQASPATPTYPSDTIDGDLIGELTRALTDGTFIPPQFMRENIKVALGLIIDGFVGFPNHEDLHTREYLHNVSVYPQSGKGESFKRSIAYPTGFLSELLKKFGVSIVDGGLFGSGEFMVKILKDASTHRSIARFDEMSEVWSKNRALGCTLEKKLLTLFESTSAAQGSFKNGVHADSDFQVSVVGDFTKESFDVSFTGSGSRGSGYLSRCIFQFADKQALAGDWQSINIERVRHILSGIEARLTEILNHDGRLIPSEGAEANSLRLDFYAWLDTQDARYIPRLKDHLKRDVLLRAVISSDGAITTEMMRRSIEWCKNQLDNRLALFPEDAGNAVEIMERGILRDITTKGQASERDLKKACNVNRAGSGGHEVFNRALRSLMFGHEIKVVGKTRKGLPVYALFEAV